MIKEIDNTIIGRYYNMSRNRRPTKGVQLTLQGVVLQYRTVPLTGACYGRGFFTQVRLIASVGRASKPPPHLFFLARKHGCLFPAFVFAGWSFVLWQAATTAVRMAMTTNEKQPNVSKTWNVIFRHPSLNNVELTVGYYHHGGP